MKRDLVIFSNRPTESGRILAKSLGARYLREIHGRRLKSLAGALIVNWGSTSIPDFILNNRNIIVVNVPEAINNSTSKVQSYERFNGAGVSTVEFTTEYDKANEWQISGSTVLGRRDGLAGGAGIRIYPSGQELGRHEFYSKYYEKTHEYRAHIFKGRIIDLTQKKRASSANIDEDRSIYQRIVRSHDNGWIHAHDGIHLADSFLPNNSSGLLDACYRAVSCLGLDFGAVDVMCRYSRKDPNKLVSFRVAEVNSAPGLGNQATIKAYTDSILALYEETKEARQVLRRKVVIPVRILTKKGNRVTRYRERYVYES